MNVKLSATHGEREGNRNKTLSMDYVKAIRLECCCTRIDSREHHSDTILDESGSNAPIRHVKGMN